MRALLLASALAFVPASASAAAFTNGSFENPRVAPPCCNTAPPAVIPGWTVLAGNVNVVNGGFGSNPPGNLAFLGNQYLDLVGQGGAGSISQTFDTVAGVVYSLRFAFSHNIFTPGPPPAAPVASANVLVSGSSVTPLLTGLVVHSTGTPANLDWRPFSGSFTADSTSTTLTFTNVLGGTNEGVFLDAVDVAAVPEPATWMMMLLGFAAIGSAMRKQKRGPRVTFSYS